LSDLYGLPMFDPIGNLPFSLEAQRARESIENHQAQQEVQKSHNRAHKLAKVLEQQQLALMHSYDRFGARNTDLQPQGQVVDMEV
jgi:hypothetical protein